MSDPSVEKKKKHPKVAYPGAMIQEETPGRKMWCACGRSSTQPYCDGTHLKVKNSPFQPVALTIERPTKVAWCGCKRTKAPPYCDGGYCLQSKGPKK